LTASGGFNRFDGGKLIAGGDRSDRKAVLVLEVHPEVRRRPKHRSEPQRGIRRNGLLLADQTFDPRAILQAYRLG